MAKQLIWRVDSVPTGRYASFSKRGWPSADYASGGVAIRIECADDYRPNRAKTGEHAPLKVYIADHSTRRGKSPEEARKLSGFTWRKLTGEFKTLDEAKAAAELIAAKHPQFKRLPLCSICKEEMGTGDPRRVDCGGDCQKCMADAGDPDAIDALAGR